MAMELNESIQLIKLLLLIVLMVVCSATDLASRRIPNAMLLPVLIAALFLNSLAVGLSGLADSIAGLAIGLLMLMPLHMLGRMGAGDIKLLGVVGSILGPWGAVAAGLATMMAGAVLGIAYLLWTFLKPGVISRISKLGRFGRRTLTRPASMSLQSVRTAEIPYAIAIATGTAAAVVYLDLLIEVRIT